MHLGGVQQALPRGLARRRLLRCRRLLLAAAAAVVARAPGEQRRQVDFPRVQLLLCEPRERRPPPPRVPIRALREGDKNQRSETIIVEGCRTQLLFGKPHQSRASPPRISDRASPPRVPEDALRRVTRQLSWEKSSARPRPQDPAVLCIWASRPVGVS